MLCLQGSRIQYLLPASPSRARRRLSLKHWILEASGGSLHTRRRASRCDRDGVGRPSARLAGSAPRRFAVDAPHADRAQRGKGGASSRGQRTIVTDRARRLDVGLPARRLDRQTPPDSSSRTSACAGSARGPLLQEAGMRLAHFLREAPHRVNAKRPARARATPSCSS